MSNHISFSFEEGFGFAFMLPADVNFFLEFF